MIVYSKGILLLTSNFYDMYLKIFFFIFFISNVITNITIAQKLVINVCDYGADKSGKKNATLAFAKCVSIISKAKKEVEKILIIPSGNYLLGEMNHKSMQGNSPNHILYFNGIENLIIKGNNATLKYENNLLYGSFKHEFGKKTPTQGISTNVATAYHIGDMFVFANSKNITIENINLHGNNKNYKYGGPWGDKGIQLVCYGIQVFGCEAVTIQNVTSSHFGADGLHIGNANRDCKNIKILNSSFEYNNRQGLSITGAQNVLIDNCKFNNSGTVYQTAPASGLDIESEGNGVINNIVIKNSEMKRNKGMAFISYNSFAMPEYTDKINNIKFYNCQFESGGEFVMEADNNNIQFYDCTIVGTVLNGNRTKDIQMSTKFVRCKFTDNSLDPIGFFNYSMIYNYSLAGKVLFQNCQFDISSKKNSCVNFIQNISYPTVQIQKKDSGFYFVFQNCSFNSANDKIFNGDWYTTIFGNVIFMDSINFLPFKSSNPTGRNGHIYFENAIFKEKTVINLESKNIIFFARTEIQHGDGFNESKLIIHNGATYFLTNCNYKLLKKSKIIVKKGGTLQIPAGNNFKVEGEIIVEKGGVCSIAEIEKYKHKVTFLK